MVGARARYRVQPMDETTDDMSASRDVTGLYWHVRGMPFVLLVAYMDPSVGSHGSNTGKYEYLLSIVRALGVPWMIYADWNLTPEQMVDSGWLQWFKGKLRVPEDMSFTCTIRPRRMIDYLMVSEEMDPFVKVLRQEHSTPWKPHLGLRVTIDKAAADMLVLKAVRPRAFPCESVEIVVPPSKTELRTRRRKVGKQPEFGQTEQEIDDFLRRPAKSFAKFKIDPDTWRGERARIAEACEVGEERAPCEIRETIGFLAGRSEASELLGDSLANWSKAAECSFIRALYLEDSEAYRGRGAAVKYHKSRLFPPPSKLAEEAVYRNASANWWRTLRARVQEACAAAEKADSEESPGRAATHLRNLQEAISKHLARDVPDEWNASDERTSVLRRSVKFLVDEGTLEDIDDLGVLDSCTKKAISRAKRERAIAFGKFAREATKGSAVAAHRVLKNADAGGATSDFVAKKDGGFTTTVLESMEVRSEFWGGLWACSNGERRSNLVRTLSQLSGEVKAGDALPKPTVQELNEALSVISGRAGRGADAWTTGELAALPSEAKRELIDIIHQAESSGCVPWQWLQTWVPLIPKPGGGDRPISLLVMLYRVWMRIRLNLLREWCAQHAGSWDDAVPGKSASSAAYGRAVMNETAAALNIPCCNVFWDVDKFYDSIDLETLIVLAKQLHYPKQILCMGLLVYTGSRRLRVGKCYAKPLAPAKSMTAGCGQANLHAKILLHALMLRMRANWPTVAPSQFVDDIQQRGEGSVVSITLRLAGAAVELVGGLAELGLKIAGKSVVTATTRALAGKVRDEIYRRTGTNLKVEDSAADLGFDNASGPQRARPKLRKRMGKFRARATRLGLFAKQRKQGQRLYRTNLFPCAAFALSESGASPKLLRVLRTAAADATGVRARGRCTTTAIAMDHSADPHDEVARVQLTAFFMHYKGLDSQGRDRMRRAWDRIARALKICPPNARWRKSRGPVGSLILLLLDAGWITIRLEHWRDPRGTDWVFSDDIGSPAVVIKAILSDLAAVRWRKAAKHYNGSGLQGGADLTAFWQMDKYYGHKEDWGARGMLRAIVAGATWTESRKTEAGYGAMELCPRCGESRETCLHRAYVCPQNTVDKAPTLDGTAYTAKSAIQAEKNGDLVPCYWYRGIVPKTTIDAIIEKSDDRRAQLGQGGASSFAVGKAAADDGYMCRGEVFVDGSGSHSDCRLRRCGWGVATISDEGEGYKWETGWFGAVGGEQTVPRAELTAALQAIKRSDPSAPLHLISDAAYFVGGWRKGKHQCTQEKNDDLWSQIGQAVKERNASTLVSKVKSHPTKEDMAEAEHPMRWFLGNAIADAMAQRGADLIALDNEAVQEVIATDAAARRILRRLVATTILAQQHGRVVDLRADRIARQDARERQRELMLQSGHVVRRVGKRCFCATCMREKPPGMNMSKWLTGPPCKGAPTQIASNSLGGDSAPVALAGQIRAGRHWLHQSHRLAAYKGVVWCWTCGSYATDEPRRLRLECQGHPAKGSFAASCLSRLRKGSTPRSGMEWPSQTGPLPGPMVIL